MNHTDIIVTILCMACICVAAMIIQDGVHQQVAALRYRQYRALVDEMAAALHKLNRQNEALRGEVERLKAEDLHKLNAQNDALRAEIKRLKNADSEADEIIRQVRQP